MTASTGMPPVPSITAIFHRRHYFGARDTATLAGMLFVIIDDIYGDAFIASRD